MLDKLFAMFNVPLNKQTLVLNENKQSKIAEMILKDGWKWNLEVLNDSVNSETIVEWTTFEGLKRLEGTTEF